MKSKESRLQNTRTVFSAGSYLRFPFARQPMASVPVGKSPGRGLRGSKTVGATKEAVIQLGCDFAGSRKGDSHPAAGARAPRPPRRREPGPALAASRAGERAGLAAACRVRAQALLVSLKSNSQLKVRVDRVGC